MWACGLKDRAKHWIIASQLKECRYVFDSDSICSVNGLSLERGQHKTFEVNIFLALWHYTSPCQKLFSTSFPRIKEEPSAVVCPVIDVIDWNTFQYLGNSGEPQIGGFDWRLVFTWHTVPEHEQKRRRSPIDVIRCSGNPLPLLPAGTKYPADIWLV